MRICGSIFVVVLTALLLGCGGNEETATSADSGNNGRTATGSIWAKRQAEFPLPKLPPKRPPLKKLVIKDLEIGRGPMARWGDEAIAHYKAVYWKTGKIFSTVVEPKPLGFELEPDGPAPGWQKGLHGMRVGGWRELLIPSDLLYDGGDAAYMVHLVRVKPREGQLKYPLPKLPATRPPLKKLVVRDLEVGEGPVVRQSDEAIVRYVGVFWKTGKLFSQNWDSSNKITLDEYGPGWEKGLQGMRVGGRREFRIPGALVFDGGTDAAYVVGLVGVKPGGKD